MTKNRIDSIIFNEYLYERGLKDSKDLEAVFQSLVRNYKLILISGCAGNEIEEFFEKTNFKKYFIDYESNGRSGHLKIDNIKQLIRRNSLKSPVYVGNTDGDRRLARIMGIPFIFINDGVNKIMDYDGIINEFSEIEELDVLK